MTTAQPRLRVSLYARLSKQASQENVSLAGMTTDLRAVVAREGFEEVALHVDDGLSGSVRDRPEFTAWLDDARQGRCDVLVAWHVDRMTREGLNVAAMMLDVVEGKNPATGKVVNRPVRLMDTRGLDSANGDSWRMAFVVMAEVARAELQRIKDRNKAKSERLRKAGRWAGGGAPYGYRIIEADGPGKTLAVEPDEAAAIREAAARILGGEPLGRVARWMTEHGTPPRRADAWSRVTLRQVLTGDAVLGRMTIGGQVERDGDGHALTPFEPILNLTESAALRQQLKPVPDAAKGGRKPARLLSGFIVCHSCGNRMQVARRTRGEVTYRCMTRSNGGACANAVVITAGQVDDYIEERWLAMFGPMPIIEERAVIEDDGQLAKTEDAIAAAVRQLAQSATPELFARLQTLQAERDQIAAAAQYTAQRTELVRTGRRFGEVWAAAVSLDDKRELLQTTVESVIIGPGHRGPRGLDAGRVDVKWRVGGDDFDDADIEALQALKDQMPAELQAMVAGYDQMAEDDRLVLFGLLNRWLASQ